MTPNEFNFGALAKIPIAKRPRGNPATRKKRYYKNIITAFDIETTRLPEIEQSIMWVWQWHFDGIGTVIGRTWQEFKKFRDRIKAVCEDEYLVVWVHNLSYEFQFLRGVYNFTSEEVFAIQPRKVLKCDMSEFLEFRCSYLHSNMRLKIFLEKMEVEHLKGEIDFTKKRYPWTPITDADMRYITHDVVGLCEAIKKEMEHDNDSLYTIPLTSTGYVRRDAKKAMRRVNHMFVKEQAPDYYTYQMLREAFRGGNTHANRYYSGKKIHNVKSADIASCYPAAICLKKFPIRPFFNAGALSFHEVLKLITRREKAVIMRIALSGVSLSNQFFGAPYLSKDKCRNIKNGVFDNGRILSAEYLETTITDIDLKIIINQYTIEAANPYDVQHTAYGKLPRALIDLNIEYFKAKTELKGVSGQEVFYTKAKNKLNSIYGMMATNPVKQDIIYNGEFIEAHNDEAEILQKSNKKAFLCYQWGVWVTAHARAMLEYGINLCGDGFVYCDTDSVKFTGNADFEKYNEIIRQESEEAGAYAYDKNGKKHYMGVFEHDGDYSEFATLGAKKYIYREKVGKLKATIAGVNKEKGGAELEANGGFDAFKQGFIFKEAGGNELVYNDEPKVKEIEIDGHKLEITSNVVIRPSTYTLGITVEYEKLLQLAESMLTAAAGGDSME